MNKNLVRIIFFAFTVIVLVFVGIFISRIGKIKVDIVAAPSTATVKIDGKAASNKTIYVSKGKHQFSADLKGFSSDSKTIDITKNTTVKLLLDPESDEAKQLLADNPELQLEREHIGSSDFGENSKKIGEKYPYISRLPISGTKFSVDYGLSQNTKTNQDEPAIALYITATDADERRNAISNIEQELSIDPGSVEIIFEDYVNPFAAEANGE
jgi:hypothetical protein